MFKLLHIVFVFSSLASFVGRVTLSQLNAELLQTKAFKITPHIIDTLLLLSGVILIFQGDWLNREWGWIASKFLLLLAYIVFGIMTMRGSGNKRWLSFATAISCFAAIFAIAISKQGFI